MTMIHSTALVDPAAQLHDSVAVGPYTVIGPHVTIGAGTTIVSTTGPIYFQGGQVNDGAGNATVRQVAFNGSLTATTATIVVRGVSSMALSLA